MITFKQYHLIQEASYSGNIGFEEMVRFYSAANPAQETQMERILKNNDWTAFRSLIKKVLKVDLK